MERDRIHDLLVGLNKQLDEVRGRCLAMKLLPNIPEISSEIRREESRR